MASKIFISIASYFDPLLVFTIREAFSKAKYPGMLRFGVVNQHINDEQRQEIMALPFASQIRYVQIPTQDTLGVSWARNLVFSLYDNEKYLLQIDSHTYFEKDWDACMIEQYWELLGKSPKPVMTTYPYPFTMEGDVPVPYVENDPQSILVLRPTPTSEISSHNQIVFFQAKHLNTREPVRGCHIAAGFLFTKGEFINEVPYDPMLYFHGEEQSLAIRAFTHGWDIYHPRNAPLRHLYKAENVHHIEHHWSGEVAKQRSFTYEELVERARKRFNSLIKGDRSLGMYGLGQTRTLDDYRILSGIDFKNFTISDVFEGKLV